MKKIIFLLALTICSCNSGNKQQSVAKAETLANFPYAFVDSKSESMGQNDNKMDLYAYGDSLNIDNLKQFCLTKKEAFGEGTFYYLVLFDNKDNAGFSRFPLTSEYGDDEEHLKHIRAYYTYNRLNGYSKLQVYDTNKWESKPKEIDI